jgi:hypothetical protein
MCELREFEGATHTLKMVYIFFEIIVIFSNVGVTGGLYIPIGLQNFRRFKLKQLKHISAPTASTGVESTDETEMSTTASRVNDASSLKEPESNVVISPDTKNKLS